MRMYKAKTVDDYIKGAPEEARHIMRELRETIKKAVPDIEEKIRWGIPFYSINGMICGFSAMNGYVNFGYVNYWEPDIKRELEAAGYATKKKIVQIRFDQKVPKDIIARLVKARAVANQNKKR